MLLYWYHFSHTASASRSRPTTTRSAGISCTCCTAKPPPELGARDAHLAHPLRRARVQRLAPSPRASSPAPAPTCYSAITGAIGALRGPKHGGANEVAFEIQRALRHARRGRSRHRASAWPDKEIIIGFGHPVYTIADPRNQVIKEVAQRLSQRRRRHEAVRHRRAHRSGDVAREEDVPEPRLVQRRVPTT